MSDLSAADAYRLTRGLVASYAAGRLTRAEALRRLLEVAVDTTVDPTGGDGYGAATRDALEEAVADGLLAEDDWQALMAAVHSCPDISLDGTAE